MDFVQILFILKHLFNFNFKILIYDFFLSDWKIKLDPGLEYKTSNIQF